MILFKSVIIFKSHACHNVEYHYMVAYTATSFKTFSIGKPLISTRSDLPEDQYG